MEITMEELMKELQMLHELRERELLEQVAKLSIVVRKLQEEVTKKED
jgi:hypothetical protein